MSLDRDKNLFEIRKWVDNYLNLPQLTDNRIKTFYRLCQNDVEVTKKKIESHYYLRKNCKLFYRRYTDNSKMEQVMRTSQMAFIKNENPVSNQDCDVLFVTKFADINPEHYDEEWTLRLLFMINDLYQNEDIRNLIIILDTNGFSIKHAFKSNFNLLIQLTNIYQESFDFNLLAIHLLNVNWITDKIISILRPYFSSLKKKIQIHSEVEEIYDYLPKQILPLDYGGSNKPMNKLHEETCQKVLSSSDWYVDEMKLRNF